MDRAMEADLGTVRREGSIYSKYIGSLKIDKNILKGK